ncbi:MAG: autotransporter domain-containing protein [Pseudomonadota bacterium]|nr:autotransporter domain-containing protein [Pseudomonadota bacterium]
MKYSKSALGLLKSQYLSVLKKCALINAGLFILAAPAGAADISNWNELKNALNSNGTYDILTNVTAAAPSTDLKTSNTAGGDKTTIQGNSNSLDFQYKKFTISANKEVEFSNINTLKFTSSNKTENNGTLVLTNINNFVSNKDIDNNGSISITGTEDAYTQIDLDGGQIKNKSDGTLTLTYVRFNGEDGDNRKTADSDGLIYNNASTTTTTLDNVIFENYIAGNNGLILQKGSLVATNVMFKNNQSARDGLIYHEDESDTLELKFIDNQMQGAGVIHNTSTIKNLKGEFTDNVLVEDKTSNGTLNNDKGVIENLESQFTHNTATNGGAIYNSGNSTNSSTIGVVTKDSTGAITNVSGGITGVTFNKNTATKAGGAVFNNANGILVFSGENNFSENTAAQNGGAIYNQGTIYFTGDTTTFSGNTANGESNAMYNAGTVHFTNGTNTFNDAINGSATNGTLNVEGENTVLALNNTVSDNDINLSNGLLKLGHTGDAVGSLADDVNFNVTGGALSLEDNATNSHNLGKIVLDENLGVSLDTDLAATASDILTANSVSGDKSMSVDNINIMADTNRHITVVQVADNNTKDKLVLNENLSEVSTDNNTYLVEYQTTDTEGNLKFGNVKALETAVQFKNAADIFDMTEDAIVEVDLGQLAHDTLTINGNDKTIDGDGHAGIIVGDNQILTMNNVSVKGFEGAAVTNNGTFNLAADTVSNIDSAIDGTGNINVSGDGQFNINNTITAGNIDVSGNGKFNVNDTITAGNMNVAGGDWSLNNGSELAAVENFVMDGGNLNVGDKTIKLGNATFNDGSNVNISVKHNGNGQISAESLTINGGDLHATLGQGIVTFKNPTKTVTLLTADNDFTDNFSSVADNNMYHFEKADKAGDYIISLVKSAADVSQEAGGTENNGNTAGAWVDGDVFEDGSISAGVADDLTDLAQNDAKAFNEALTALAPADAPLVRTISVNHNNQVFHAVTNRLNNTIYKGKYGLSSGDALTDGVGVWVQVNGNRIELDDNSRAYGFEIHDYGITMGLDKQLTNAVKAGIGYSYFMDDANAFKRDVDVDTHTIFAYGEYRPTNKWYINGVAAFGWSDYDESKYVAGKTYKAKYDVENLGLQAMTGYNAEVANIEVTPEAGLRYNNISRDFYKDTADQRVQPKTMDVLTAVAGVKAGKDLVSCFGSHSFYWHPDVHAAVTYDLISDKESSLVRLSNGSGYFVDGERVKRFGIEAGAGVTMYFTPKVESTVGYEGKFREDYTDHTGYANIKYKF